MPEFRRPRSPEGRRLRKAAWQSSRPKIQQLVESLIGQDDESERQSVENVVWQLRHGDPHLSRHAAREVQRVVGYYDSKDHDSSGRWGRVLVLISRLLDIDLGEIISAREDENQLIEISRRSHRNPRSSSR